MQLQHQGEYAQEPAGPCVDFQIVRDGEVCWTIRALSDEAREMAAREFKLGQQAPDAFRIVAGYLESIAFVRYLTLRGFSVRPWTS